MKRLIAIGLAAVMLAVLGFGTADAYIKHDDGTVTVTKGDNPSQISCGIYGTSRYYPEIMKAAKITNPKRLPIGIRFAIPEVGTIMIHNFNTAPYGAKGEKADTKTLKGIDDTSYVPAVKKCLRDMVSNNNPFPYFMEKGFKADYVSDKNGIYGPHDYEFGYSASTMKWSDKECSGNLICTLLDIEKCGNFTAKCVPIPKTPKAPEEPKAPETPITIPIIPVSEKDIIIPDVVPDIPQIIKPFVYREIKCRDYEINAGAGYLFGSLGGMRDAWGYAEGITPWSSCYYFGHGPGFYLNGDLGLVSSGYDWNKYGIGYQHGFRYLDHTVDKDGIVHEYGLTAKLRLAWARMYGENAPYEMTQDDLLLGLYAEYIYQLDQKTLVGVTFEGWISLWSKMDSIWSGDSPSNQTRASIGGFIQKQINDDWQARVGANIFYQAWDENFGLGVFAEARYHEWLMCGVTANFLFDGGVVWGPYCRAEAGNYIRSERDKEIIAGIVCIEGCEDENIEKNGGEFSGAGADEEIQLGEEKENSPSSVEGGYVNIENLK